MRIFGLLLRLGFLVALSACQAHRANSSAVLEAASAPVVGTRTLVHHFPPHEDLIYGLEIDPQNPSLAISTDQRGHAVMWNLASQERLWDVIIKLHKQPQAIRFSHDGNFVAVGGTNSNLQILRVATGELIRELKLPPNANQDVYYDLTFSPDDRFLLSAAGDEAYADPLVLAHFEDWRKKAVVPKHHRIVLWNTENGGLVQQMTVTASTIRDIEFAADGTRFYTVDYQTLRVFKSDFTPLVMLDVAAIDPTTSTPVIIASNISPDLRFAALSTVSGIVLVNLENQEPALRIPAPLDKLPLYLRFTADLHGVIGIDYRSELRVCP